MIKWILRKIVKEQKPVGDIAGLTDHLTSVKDPENYVLCNDGGTEHLVALTRKPDTTEVFKVTEGRGVVKLQYRVGCVKCQKAIDVSREILLPRRWAKLNFTENNQHFKDAKKKRQNEHSDRGNNKAGWRNFKKKTS